MGSSKIQGRKGKYSGKTGRSEVRGAPNAKTDQEGEQQKKTERKQVRNVCENSASRQEKRKSLAACAS